MNTEQRKPKILSTLGSYLLQHRRGILLSVVFSVIFLAVFALYNLPLEAVGYAFLCCGALALLAASADFAHYYRRHCEMVYLQQTIAAGTAALPVPENLTERDYTLLLQLLDSERLHVISEAEHRVGSMKEYYTLWAHQIKTPIAAMGLLLQSSCSEETPELSAELFKIEQYVDMVLSYLRLQSDSNDYVIREYDLDSLVRQTVHKYAGQFIRKKLTLTLGDLHSTVLTDEKWLCFVLGQIFSNAIKYTNRGGVTVTLEENQTLCIADTGIGIAPEDLPRLGEQGFTGFNGRSDKRATGIGLYLCRIVLGRLSHSMEITSEIGKGTCVRLHLGHIRLEKE
ncbi:MAG: sensor histidine kinase [Firmicutes bacterium]|nr:sensor histidine kinase [Bacillota bacterium]